MRRFGWKRFFMATVFALVLAGCTTGQKNTLEPEVRPNSPVYVAFANKSINSYFYIIINASLEMEARKRGWEYELVVADYDSVKQNNQLINLVEKKPDAIIINPINSETLTYGIRMANGRKIPICVVDTPASDGHVSLTVSFDNYLAGQMAAEEIVERLVEKYGEPRGIVYEAVNNQNSLAWALRKQGFQGVLEKYPQIRHIAENGYSDPDIISNNLQNLLDTVQVDAVHCSSDHQSRGVVQALQKKKKWKRVGEDGHVILVTIDGDPSSMQGIRDGYYDASIVQDAILYGTLTIRLLDEFILAGKPLQEGDFIGQDSRWERYAVTYTEQGCQVMLMPYVLDVSNVEEPEHWGNIAQNEWKFQYK